MFELQDSSFGRHVEPTIRHAFYKADFLSPVCLWFLGLKNTHIIKKKKMPEQGIRET